jgi:hypothetical protein
MEVICIPNTITILYKKRKNATRGRKVSIFRFIELIIII